MGTPPDGVYVLTRDAAGGKPRVVATLVDPADRRTVTDFSVRDGAVQATLLGYSSPDVPSCCPDLKDGAKWQWKNGAFVRSTPAGAHAV
ncbi:Secreted protein OS=Streptomyces fumanus OX=67302 GN=GCM10018772_46420 PE=4 SV=1 [Streptomyces fumanus]